MSSCCSKKKEKKKHLTQISSKARHACCSWTRHTAVQTASSQHLWPNGCRRRGHMVPTNVHYYDRRGHAPPQNKNKSKNGSQQSSCLGKKSTNCFEKKMLNNKITLREESTKKKDMDRKSTITSIVLQNYSRLAYANATGAVASSRRLYWWQHAHGVSHDTVRSTCWGKIKVVIVATTV